MNVEDSKLQKIQTEVRRLNDVKLGIEKSCRDTVREKSTLDSTITNLRKTETALESSVADKRSQLSKLEKSACQEQERLVKVRQTIELEKGNLAKSAAVLESNRKALETEKARVQGMEVDYRTRLNAVVARELTIRERSQSLDAEKSKLDTMQKTIDAENVRLTKLSREIAKEQKRLGLMDSELKSRSAFGTQQLSDANESKRLAQEKLRISEIQVSDAQRILSEVKRREAKLDSDRIAWEKSVQAAQAALTQQNDELSLEKLRVAKLIREKDIAKELEEFKKTYA